MKQVWQSRSAIAHAMLMQLTCSLCHVWLSLPKEPVLSADLQMSPQLRPSHSHWLFTSSRSEFIVMTDRACHCGYAKA